MKTSRRLSISFGKSASYAESIREQVFLIFLKEWTFQGVNSSWPPKSFCSFDVPGFFGGSQGRPWQTPKKRLKACGCWANSSKWFKEPGFPLDCFQKECCEASPAEGSVKPPSEQATWCRFSMILMWDSLCGANGLVNIDVLSSVFPPAQAEPRPPASPMQSLSVPAFGRVETWINENQLKLWNSNE